MATVTPPFPNSFQFIVTTRMHWQKSAAVVFVPSFAFKMPVPSARPEAAAATVDLMRNVCFALCVCERELCPSPARLLFRSSHQNSSAPIPEVGG